VNPALAIFVVLLATGGALAQKKDTASSQFPARELLTRSWRIPPGFLPKAEDNSTAQKHDPTALNNQADASEFLVASGVTFPEGAFARYYPDANTLLIRNTAVNLDLAEVFPFSLSL